MLQKKNEAKTKINKNAEYEENICGDRVCARRHIARTLNGFRWMMKMMATR